MHRYTFIVLGHVSSMKQNAKDTTENEVTSISVRHIFQQINDIAMKTTCAPLSDQLVGAVVVVIVW